MSDSTSYFCLLRPEIGLSWGITCCIYLMNILRYNIFQFCLLSKLIINSSAQDVTFPRPRVSLVDGWKARELNIVFWPLQGIFLHHFMTKKFCTKNYFWHRIEPSLMSTNIYILVWGNYNPTKFVFQNPQKKSVWERFAVTPDFFFGGGGGYYDLRPKRCISLLAKGG